VSLAGFVQAHGLAPSSVTDLLCRGRDANDSVIGTPRTNSADPTTAIPTAARVMRDGFDARLVNEVQSVVAPKHAIAIGFRSDGKCALTTGRRRHLLLTHFAHPKTAIGKPIRSQAV